MTQLELAFKNKTSESMRRVAKAEGVSVNFLRKRIAEGKIVIPDNPLHLKTKTCGIGEGLRTKINANIGTTGTRRACKGG